MNIYKKTLKEINNLQNISFKTRIAVICGGKSLEREVSLRTGKKCYEALKKIGYKKVFNIDADDNLVKKLKKHKIEIAFLGLHGTYGEDGCIQGLLEYLDIKYTGSKVLSSAICMDKITTKELLNKDNIPTPNIFHNIKEVKKFPVFCKPANQGSSLQAEKISNKAQLKKHLSNIKRPLIEEYIKGRELTVGVLEINNKLYATEILEIKVKKGEYDYDNKYTKDALEFTCPAKISKHLEHQIKEYAISSFKAVKSQGYARVDILLKGQKPYVLEVNTLPGLTDESDLPYQSEKSGISYEKLINLILHSALL